MERSMQKSMIKGKGIGERIVAAYLVYLPLLIAEMVGTATMMIIGCTLSAVDDESEDESVTKLALEQSFAFGIGFAVAIEVFGSISGGHFNPAVSAGVFIADKMEIFQMIFYVIAQYTGACLGCTAVYMFYVRFMNQDKPDFCIVRRKREVTITQAIILEAVPTGLLMITMSSLLDCRNGRPGRSSSIRLGFMLMGFTCSTYAYTGASFNPARSIAPSLIGNTNLDEWVYQLGPYGGSVIGAAIYRFIFESTGNLYKLHVPAGVRKLLY